MDGRLYTGAGDAGETSLAGGERVRKDDLRIEACGALDEAASALGLARVAVTDTPLDLTLAFVQQRLLNLAALIATPSPSDGDPRVTDGDVTVLERAADDLMRSAGGFAGFTLPGGCEAAARLHLARAVLRRAERRIVSLSSAETVDPEVLRFANRASDLVYAAARFANAAEGVDEQAWDRGFTAPDRRPHGT